MFESFLEKIHPGRPHILTTCSEVSALFQLRTKAMEALKAGSRKTDFIKRHRAGEVYRKSFFQINHPGVCTG